MALTYRRWWFRLAGIESVYTVRRDGMPIGFAAREGRHWMAGYLPDGTWARDDSGCARYFRRRDDVALHLAMVEERMVPA